MPAVTLGTADAVLKEVLEPTMQRMLNDDTPLLQVIESSSSGVKTDTSNVGGKYVRFPIHISRNTGVGARREMEDLPLPGNQGYTNAQVNLAYLYGRIQVSGQVVKLADSDRQAFISVVDDETTRLASDLAVDLNRQLYSDGTGKLGATTTVGSSVTAAITNDDVRKFQVGMYVDVFTSAAFDANVAGTTTAPKASGYISDVDFDADTITMTAAVSWADGDVITRNGNVMREVLGLEAIVADDNEIYGINAATQRLWRSIVDDNGGTPRPVSEALMTKLTNQIRVNGGRVNIIIMPLGVQAAYVNLLQQNRTIVNTTAVTGGVSNIAFTTTSGNIRILDDHTAPPGTMYGLTTRDLTLYQEADWKWWDEDGGIWRWVPNKDAKDAFMYRYLQLGAHRRNSHFVIKDLIEG